jgi:SAM-dependent methyltransferase
MSSEGPENMKERLKEAYDAIAPTYNEWTKRDTSLRLEYVEKLLDHLPQIKAGTPTSLLEVGCGCGLPVSAKLLSYPNTTVTANDLSSVQVELARKNLVKSEETPNGVSADRVILIPGDMLALDFPPAAFDAVIGLYSLIHLPREEQVQMIAKIAQWLKPGGVMLANFSAEAMAGTVMDGWLDERGWMFWSGWGAEESTRKIKESGLQIVLNEVTEDVVDASFLWVIARKRN